MKVGDGVRTAPIGTSPEFAVGAQVFLNLPGSKGDGLPATIDEKHWAKDADRDVYLLRVPGVTKDLGDFFYGHEIYEAKPERKTVPAGAGPGEKDDSTPTGVKARYDLIPTALEEGVAAVLTYGAFQRPRADGSKGYGKNNWQGVEDARGRYWAAMRRHLAAHRRGEKNDVESGLSHLSHAATNLAFLMSFEAGHDPVL